MSAEDQGTAASIWKPNIVARVHTCFIQPNPTFDVSHPVFVGTFVGKENQSERQW